jgi:hypothetical protein
MGAVQIFCNRSSRPYSRDTLGDDFRDVRAKVFGGQGRRVFLAWSCDHRC